MSPILPLLDGFFAPDLSPGYLAALVRPVLETLGLVLGAMTLATLLALPLGMAAAIRLPAARWLTAALALFRALPDLTLAICCVVLLGIGTGAALTALVLYYTAVMAKVFADLMETAPQRPLEALAASGANRWQLALYGLIPLTGAHLLAYGAFAFECAVRAAVIVGAVGGGGIGAELAGSLAAYDLPRAATLIIVLVLLIALLDQAATWLRTRPIWLLALVPAGLACAANYGPRLFAFGHAITVLGEALPPTLSGEALAKLPLLVWETLWIAAAGTAGAAVLGLTAALAASRRFAPVWLRLPVRRLLDLLRAMPELVWGMILVAFVGLGPAAGAWALGLHSLGSLGRLFADGLDNAPERPQQALAQTGASGVAVAAYATVPLALETLATHLLFRFEWNLRMATVLGVIGAGGIGQALYEAQQLFFYREALAWVIVTAALILAVDALSARLRRNLRLAQGMSAIPRPYCLAATQGAGWTAGLRARLPT